MSNHLDKAKQALADAKAPLDVDLSTTLPPLYVQLLDIAITQAAIAQAEALERIADRLDNYVLVDVKR